MTKKKGLDILFEDNHLIIVNKKGGALSQKDKTGDDSLIEDIKAYLKVKYNKPGDVFLGSIHRLDRPTSGAIVFARTSKALSRMNELFKSGKVDKQYIALVDNRPPNEKATLEDYLKKNASQNKSFVVTKSKEGSKRAKLEYELIGERRGEYVLRIILHTGRHHQIRAQLSNIGCRIIGDLKYGFKAPNEDKSICLHCTQLSFIHPVQKTELRVKAPLPVIKEWREIGRMLK